MKTMKAATNIIATLACVLMGVPATAADRPNIIVMMVDDMGFAGPSIAPYDNPHYKTPGMDRLASEGMLFTDFHASGAICSATRAGLMTGRYQQRAGIEAVIHPHATHPEHCKGLHEDEVTFAELFRDAGYSTGLVGKWHLGYAGETPKYHPMNHGFDYFMGYVSGNIDYINHWGDHMQHDWWHGRKETKEEGYTTHLINKYALEFIEQNKDQPFCLYIAHESPHSPVQGPDDPIQRGPGAKKRSTPHAEAMKRMILEMDKGVEQVRARLVKLGLEKNTLFLFFSDNGDAPGTATGSPRFRGHKGSVYEGGTRVPAVAWWPGRIKAGTQAADLSITLDVMPTILSVAGIDPPKERSFDGIDLSPVLFEQKALPARPLFWTDLSNNGSRSEALRDGPWKLVVQHPKAKPGTFENDAIELFNLTNDEGEETNLAAKQPERAAEMLERIKAWYADTQETASPQPGGWLSAARDARDGGMRELLAASIYASPNVDIAVPNGPYTLQLLLYEGWRSRSADIVIEGKTVRAAYDMFKEQGGNFDHGSVLRHTFTLTDGNIDIEIKGPLHLGGLILSKGKADSADRVAIVKSQAELDLKDVIKAINFGDTNDLNIGDIKFAAAAVNTTVDGVSNTAGGDVYAGEYQQKLPLMQNDRSPKRADAKGKPNVVVIFTDDLGWTDLGCYGSKFYETPHIDRLANQGVLFRNAYAACNVCSPTRAALMTGKYPQRVGFTDWLNPDRPFGPNSAATTLPASEVTIGEAFQQAGYRTGYIGKWHLGPQEHAMPKQQGFDWQMASCRHGYPSSYFFPYRKNTSGDVPDLENGKPGDYLTDALTTRAIGFMEETVKTDEKPFFLVLGHYAVHTPIEAPKPLVDKYTRKKQRILGDDQVQTVAESGQSRTRVEQSNPVYAGMIENLDTNVGRVVAALEKLGVADNTIILFTSDNGGESNNNRNIAPTSNFPLRAGKGWNYEGGIRVPTFVTWPGHIAAQECDERVITMDIYPTLLELTGLDAKPHQHLDGRSLLPLIEGKAETVKRPFLAWRKPNQRGASRPSAAIIKGDWKLIHYLGTESTELYNLDDDPGEANDLAASEAGKSSELLNILNKWTEETEFKNPKFFNGKDLAGWKGNDGYWSVKDGAIVGHSEKNVPRNEFIWSDVEVRDFHLVVDVKLTPDDRNAGIQFRSKPIDAHGQAIGYQADVGAGVWGKLYHEHGRGKLDWNDNAAGAVKPGQWNKYEILADGHRIWTALNGKLCVAIEDPTGELAGRIAFQIHGGPPQTVHYRNPILTHDPKIELAGLSEKELIAKLPKKELPGKKLTAKELPYWSRLMAGADPGSQEEAWAKPTFDHSKWKTMKVPGHFDAVELPGFDGVVWFRKTVELSVEQAKAAATLHVGQVDDMDVTWVNGTRVGGYETPGHHYTVRNYPVPAGVLKPGNNVIAVRVMDHGAPGGISGTPEQLFLQLDEERLSLANRWHFAPGANLAALHKYSQVPTLLRPLARPKTPVPAFADGFAINSDQTIVIFGGTNALESGRHGYLETLLTAAHPQHRVRLRNLAWQADTVYVQQRPRNFYAPNKPDYGERDGRRQINADLVFFWMGQSESLDGPQRIEEFKAAYLKHLDQIGDYTKRIVLVTPVPFSNPLRLEIDIQKRNKSLAVYVDAIRQIGRDRKLPVVDLFRSLTLRVEQPANKLDSESQATFSRNGLHLSTVGHWDAAQAIATQLGFADRVASIKWFDSDDPLEPPSAEKLRQAIVKKNDLWFRYWRPTNWAFLYGNRQTQPSSRDHKNPGRRWFPEELQDALPHLNEAEQRIHEATKAASR
jgi:arylsulfatase A